MCSKEFPVKFKEVNGNITPAGVDLFSEDLSKKSRNENNFSSNSGTRFIFMQESKARHTTNNVIFVHMSGITRTQRLGKVSSNDEVFMCDTEQHFSIGCRKRIPQCGVVDGFSIWSSSRF